MTVPDPVKQPTMTVEAAGEALGIARSSAYEAVRCGEIPSIRVGRRLVIPTAAIRKMLQLDTGQAHCDPTLVAAQTAP